MSIARSAKCSKQLCYVLSLAFLVSIVLRMKWRNEISFDTRNAFIKYVSRMDLRKQKEFKGIFSLNNEIWTCIHTRTYDKYLRGNSISALVQICNILTSPSVFWAYELFGRPLPLWTNILFEWSILKQPSRTSRERIWIFRPTPPCVKQ